jgi:hypothetical protein
MGKSAWFNEDEVRKAILGIPGVSAVPDSFDVKDAIEAVVAEVEATTRFVPFLAIREADWLYDPPSWARGQSDLLDLKAGFVAISAIRVGATNSYAGDMLTAGSDYWLEPHDAPERNRPYTWVRFASFQSGPRRSIKVTGTKGFARQIPLDLWDAALKTVVARALVEEAGKSGVATRIRQGPVDLQFSGDAGRDTVARLQERLRQAALRYKRM